MRIAVSGSSGLIGSTLARSLRSEGHTVVRLVRHPPGGPDEVGWDPMRQRVDAAGLAGCDGVVHLAGAGVGDRRWSAAYKRQIRDSRVLGTAAVAGAVASLDRPPRVLLSGSAVGFYGDAGERAVDESAPPGRGFLPELCQEWEAAAGVAAEAGVRTVALRTGLVVARGGGAWQRLFPLFRLGLGGRLGSGDQFWSFIALRDQVAALRFLLTADDVSGPVNLTAPEPATNREVTAAMGRALHRPTPFPVPAPALRVALGELAGDVLGSVRAVPGRLLDAGFSFDCPRIDDAVRAALAG